MELHLVNGFLGSGKTTAIIAATKYLMQQGKTVGIVTNDKGQFQVDTAFFQSSHIPTSQVTGGCFRCSFSEFEEKITQLQQAASPEIIFAESVGSCVDLVNTIVSPIRQNYHLDVDKLTYSVFADMRLFRRWIFQEPLPFSEQIAYLFAKQIEESSLLILNKSDLLSSERQINILAAAVAKFPEKTILLQNSLDQTRSLPWFSALDSLAAIEQCPGFTVDYPTYKNGEKEMAWLDQKLTIESQDPGEIKAALIHLVSRLLAALQNAGVLVGHVKLFIPVPEEGTKISFTTADLLEKPLAIDWKASVPDMGSHSLVVTLNARVAMDADQFSAMLKNAVEEAPLSPRVRIRREGRASYNPEMSLLRP